MLRVAIGLQRAVALGLIACSCPAVAVAAQGPPSTPVSAAPDTLRPGQYRWHPEAAPDEGDLGGTMRLGTYEAVLTGNSVVRSIYGADKISERHRHRDEVDAHYKDALEAGGLVFSGMSPDGELPEIVERPDHPWFIGVQFRPS